MLRILVHLINNKLEKVTLKTNQPAVIITRNAFLCIQFPETKWKKCSPTKNFKLQQRVSH